MGERPIYKYLEQQIKELKKEATRCRAAEEELRMSKEILSQIVQGNTIPTCVIDNQHRITHCNRDFENLTGIAADEIIGTRKQWMVFYSEERPVMADFIVDKASADELARYYGKK